MTWSSPSVYPFVYPAIPMTRTRSPLPMLPGEVILLAKVAPLRVQRFPHQATHSLSFDDRATPTQPSTLNPDLLNLLFD
jgi:hypothetical protein